MSYAKLAAAVAVLGAVTVFAVIKLVFPSAPPPVAEAVSSPDATARKSVAAAFPGEILFDSNRSGTFGIYAKRVDADEQRTIFDSPLHDMYPDSSPDGRLITFSQSKSAERDARSDIYIMNRDGSGVRLLAKDGTFPSFSGDGKLVYFERNRKQILAIAPDGTGEREIFPAGDAGFAALDNQVVKPRVSLDGRYAFFTSDKDGKWNSYAADLTAKTTKRMQHGCEPSPYANGKDAVWVYKKQMQGGSGFNRYELATGKTELLHDAAPPRGHDYFPSIVANDKFLLYSSCREGEHSHEDSNYQIFAKDLESGTLARVTFDEFTNRWPRLLPPIQ